MLYYILLSYHIFYFHAIQISHYNPDDNLELAEVTKNLLCKMLNIDKNLCKIRKKT